MPDQGPNSLPRLSADDTGRQRVNSPIFHLQALDGVTAASTSNVVGGNGFTSCAEGGTCPSDRFSFRAFIKDVKSP